MNFEITLFSLCSKASYFLVSFDHSEMFKSQISGGLSVFWGVLILMDFDGSLWIYTESGFAQLEANDDEVES